jgi:hypothetical protein
MRFAEGPLGPHLTSSCTTQQTAAKIYVPLLFFKTPKYARSVQLGLQALPANEFPLESDPFYELTVKNRVEQIYLVPVAAQFNRYPESLKIIHLLSRLPL